MCAYTSPAKSAPASWLNSSHSDSRDNPRQYETTAKVKSWGARRRSGSDNNSMERGTAQRATRTTYLAEKEDVGEGKR